jgi:hypothetical protein
MMKPILSLLAVLTGVLTLGVIPLRASDPVGVYCLIDKVVLEPSVTKPTAIQIWGAFSFAVRPSSGGYVKPEGGFGNAATGDVYAAVQKGYLYYTCPKAKEAACQSEWADLKSVAGKHEVLGFGGRHETNGSVRQTSDRPVSPDVYPLNVGVVKIGWHGDTGLRNQTQYPDLIAALEAALKVSGSPR